MLRQWQFQSESALWTLILGLDFKRPKECFQVSEEAKTKPSVILCEWFLMHISQTDYNIFQRTVWQTLLHATQLGKVLLLVALVSPSELGTSRQLCLVTWIWRFEAGTRHQTTGVTGTNRQQRKALNGVDVWTCGPAQQPQPTAQYSLEGWNGGILPSLCIVTLHTLFH